MRVTQIAWICALWTVAVCAPSLWAAEASEAEQKDIAEYIKKLSADDFAVREDAEKKLTALGQKALPALKESAKGGDPEAQKRAAAIVDKIENGDEEALLNTCEYYPLKVGTQWDYKVGEVTIIMKVEAHEKVGEHLCGKVVGYANGQPVTNESIGVRKDGVYRYANNGFEVKPPFKVMQFPIKAGDEWKLNSELMNQKITGTNKCAEEKGVKVEAGTYDVVTVSSDDTETSGIKITQKVYYAKNVGMVKQDVMMNGQAVNLELVKYTPGDGVAKPLPKPAEKTEAPAIAPDTK